MFWQLGEVIVYLCKFLSPPDILYLSSINKNTRNLMENYCKNIWRGRCLRKWDELGLATQISDNEWKEIYLRKSKEDTDLDSVMKLKQFRSCDWYSCPNGHLYLIGECRLPMQIGKCPTCGVPIGGKSHRMLDNNRRLGRVDRESLKNKKIQMTSLSSNLLEGTLDSETFHRNARITPTMSANFTEKTKKTKRKKQRRPKNESEEDMECDIGSLFS